MSQKLTRRRAKICGLFGVIYKSLGGFNHQQLKAMQEGLYVDALRGEDATGVALINTLGDVTIIKEASDANYFLGSKEWDALTGDALKNGRAMLGHNRKATVGSIKDETAHPFVIDDEFVFFHNGSLYSWKGKHGLGYDDYEVDSNALGHHLRDAIRDGADMGEALGDVNGAYACVWYDMVTEKIGIIRNSQRPLYIMETGTCYIYCSEPEMGHLVARRNSLHVMNSSEVPIDTLVSFDLQDSVIRPILKKVTVKKAMAQPASNQDGGPTHGKTLVTKGSSQRWSSFRRTKSSYKKWRNEQIGEYCCFWVEDYERVKDTNSTFLLSGTLDIEGVDELISIKAFTNADEEYIYHNYLEQLVGGIIKDVYIDGDFHTGEIVIVMANINRMAATNESEVE